MAWIECAKNDDKTFEFGADTENRRTRTPTHAQTHTHTDYRIEHLFETSSQNISARSIRNGNIWPPKFGSTRDIRFKAKPNHLDRRKTFNKL